MVALPDMAGWLRDQVGLSFDVQQRLLATIVVLLVVMGGRRALMRAVDRHVKADEAIHAWRRGSFYVMWTLLVIVLLRLWIDGLSGVGTFLGLLVAGIAVALNQPLQSVAAWTYIVARRPFSIGDRIEVGTRMGEVVDIRLFSTLLYEVRGPLEAEQSTGRIVHIPNKMMLEVTLINASRGLGMLWNEVPVLITFESDWERARALVEEITNGEAERYALKARERARKAVREVLIKPGSLGPRVYLTVRDSGVLLTARYLVDVRDRRESDDRVWTALLQAFGNEDAIDLAYPTRRSFVNHIEGKSGAKAPAWPPAPMAYLGDASEDGPDSR
jgi:small-conductance mechanosensitive channel